MAQSRTIVGVELGSLKCFVGNKSRVLNERDDLRHDRIRSVGINPILMRGEPNANGTIEKCLCKSRRGGILTWVKELAVLSPNMNATLMDIAKDASRCEAGNCSVKAECVRRVRELVCDVVTELMARDKFKRGYRSNISMTVVKELDPVMVSKQIGSFIRDKRWAEAIHTDDTRTDNGRWIMVGLVKVIKNVDPRRYGGEL